MLIVVVKNRAVSFKNEHEKVQNTHTHTHTDTHTYTYTHTHTRGSVTERDPRYFPMAEAGPNVAFTAPLEDKTLPKNSLTQKVDNRRTIQSGFKTINPSDSRD